MWDEAIRKTKEWLKNMWDVISGWFSELPSKLGNFFGEILGFLVTFLTIGIPAEIIKFQIWASKKVIELFGDLLKWIKENWDNIWQWILSLPSKLWQAGKDIVLGLWNGIVDTWTKFKDFIKGLIDGFVDGFKKALGIHSPSTIFADIGKNIIQGLLNGLSSMWTTLISKVSGWVSDLKSKFNLDNIKIKTPHISWSSYGAQATGTLAKILSLLNLPTQLPKLNVSWYGMGGLPDIGELFVAREAGPELVGSIGGKNAVMNNNQIVEAVSSGVASAVASVLGGNGSSYQLYIDGEQITDVVQRRLTRRANITGMAMGV